MRTRFAKDIVVEFAAPTRASKKAIVFCSGMPSVPNMSQVLSAYAKRGYWTFHFRYRGSWESGGRFLEKSPEEDVRDVLRGLQGTFRDLWSGRKFSPKPKDVYLCASSFGGAPGLLASRDKRVKRIVALSPVVDWTAPSKAEPMDRLYGFVREAFGNGYRFDKKDWERLARGNFCNPVRHLGAFDGEKMLIVHCKDDESVLWKPVARFARETHAGFILRAKGGHLGISNFLRPSIMKATLRFFSR